MPHIATITSTDNDATPVARPARKWRRASVSFSAFIGADARQRSHAITTPARARSRNGACTTCTTTEFWCVHAHSVVAYDTLWSTSASSGTTMSGYQVRIAWGLHPRRPIHDEIDRDPRQ